MFSLFILYLACIFEFILFCIRSNINTYIEITRYITYFICDIRNMILYY